MIKPIAIPSAAATRCVLAVAALIMPVSTIEFIKKMSNIVIARQIRGSTLSTCLT